jgi:HK97 gp10 family phage protein
MTGVGLARVRLKQVSASLVGAKEPAEHAGAVIVEADAKRRAAVLSGEMRDSVHIEGSEVVTDSDHAVFNEFGTSVMAAQPFMRPAADENEGKVHAIMAAVFRAALGRFGA